MRFSIIRIDDVNGSNLHEIVKFFTRLDIKASLFLTHTDSPHFWKKKDWLLVKNIIKHGWEVGGHSRSHKPLVLLKNKEMLEEIIGNIKDIEEKLYEVGVTYKVTSFAYPCGEYNTVIKEILRSHNILFGLTCPDALGYKSLERLEDLNEVDPLSLGVTNTGNPINLNLWNYKFMTSNIYILALHPDPFIALKPRTLLNAAKNFNIKYVIDSIKFLKILEEHIRFMLHHGAKFITFKELWNLLHDSWKM